MCSHRNRKNDSISVTWKKDVILKDAKGGRGVVQYFEAFTLLNWLEKSWKLYSRENLQVTMAWSGVVSLATKDINWSLNSTNLTNGS